VAQTFSKRRRLRAQSEFRRVQGRGIRFSRGGILLLVDRSPAGGEAEPRLGMVVSRKVGNAVKRNAVKRWLREWFRQSDADLPRGLDLVVIAKRGAVEGGHRALIDDIGSLVSRAAKALA
jgi:ribonuclease P protein component